METFEFINILQTHGFPRVIGVLTRLDRVGAQPVKNRLPAPNNSSSNSSSNSNSNNNNNNSHSSPTHKRDDMNRDRSISGEEKDGKLGSTQHVRRRKKELKKRFWTEIYEGAKLFYLTGLQFEGKYYKKREILNLSRYIAVQRFSTLSWRSAHPYLLALRCEPLVPLLPAALSPSNRNSNSKEITALSNGRASSISVGDDEEQQQHQQQKQKQQGETDVEGEKETAACAFYGYVRGAVLRQGQWLHIPGAGDFQIKTISCCDDPCPSPAASKQRVSSRAKCVVDGEEGYAEEEKSKETVTRRTRRMRSLKDQQRAIYAPAADVGSVRVDADAMYIHLPDSKVSFTRSELLLREGEEKPSKEALQQDEKLNSTLSDNESSNIQKRESLKKKKKSTSGSSTRESSDSGVETESSSGEEDEEEEEEGIGDGDAADLGAGDREKMIIKGISGKKKGKKEKEEEIGDAVKMVRELQEAQQILHVRQQEQQLRLLPTSACTLSSSSGKLSVSTASSMVRQLSAASDSEEDEEEVEKKWEEDMDEEEEEERRILLEAQQQEEGTTFGRNQFPQQRRAAPPGFSRATARDSNKEDSDDVTATESEREEEEEEGEEEEEEEEEEKEGETQEAIDAIHAAARKRFQRPPTLQDILYSADPRVYGHPESRHTSTSNRATTSSSRRFKSKGIISQFLGDQTVPLFGEEEDEEDEEEDEDLLQASSSNPKRYNSSKQHLYGSLPPVLPMLTQQQRYAISCSQKTEEENSFRGSNSCKDNNIAIGKAASVDAGAAAAAMAGTGMLMQGEDEEEEEEERDEGGDTAVVTDEVLYAAVDKWDLAGDMQKQKEYWNSEKMEELKACYFITGGWSSAEEEEEEKQKKNSKEKKVFSGVMDGSVEQQDEEEKEKQQIAAETRRQMLEARELQEEEQQLQGGGIGGCSSSSSASQLYSGACACIGTFVRVYIENIPLRWLQHLSPNRLVLLGGLSAGEQGQSYLKLRGKKHRWYPRVLKSDDVLLFSAGWRRFQSLPLFAIEDRSEARLRYLKYTPEHLHCLCCAWGPVLPAATPFLAIRFTHATAHYRICLSGLLLETSPSLILKKKLKLLGEPKKIYKNTAFISQMFNSDLEVNMCLGAKIQTVSGIRGQIKKAHGSHGVYRAAFEDKILMSDLVVCKSWLSLQPRQFYNAVLDIPEWVRLRTLVEIRQALQLPAPRSTGVKQICNSSSAEGVEEGTAGGREGGNTGGVGALQNQRRATIFNPIRIPKQLMLKLPFHTRTKLQLRTSRLKKLKGREKEEEEEIRKPLVNAYDRRVAALLQRLQTIRNARLEKKKEKQQHALEKKAAAAAKVAAEKSRKQLEIRRKRYIKQGKTETAMRKKMRFSSSS